MRDDIERLRIRKATLEDFHIYMEYLLEDDKYFQFPLEMLQATDDEPRTEGPVDEELAFWRQEFEAIKQHELEVFGNEDYYSKMLSDNQFMCFIIEDSGSPIGFIEISRTAKVYHVWQFQLDEEYHTQHCIATILKQLMAQKYPWGQFLEFNLFDGGSPYDWYIDLFTKMGFSRHSCISFRWLIDKTMSNQSRRSDRRLQMQAKNA